MRYKDEITDNLADAINDLEMLDKTLSKGSISAADVLQRIRNINRFILLVKERIDQN